MTLRSVIRFALAATVGALAIAGCSRNTPTEPWPPITDPVVFTDGFSANVGFQAFLGSKYDAMTVDATEHHTGTTSLKFVVPAPGDPTGGYAGGAFVASQARSLTLYNALSFWVKASRAVSLETAGLGNDNTGTSLYEAKRTAIPVTTGWTQVIVPIPQPALLQQEKGLFFFAEGPQSGAGLTLWFDDIQFVYDATITNPRPSITTQTLTGLLGATLNLQGTTRTVFSVGGTDQFVTHMPAYFTFASSNTSVAAIAGRDVHVVGAGTAALTAKLGSLDATGTITVNAIAPPAEAAPTPSVPTSNVIALYSDAYPNVAVDAWQKFGTAGIKIDDLTIAGNATKLYENLNLGFIGAEFKTHEIDATAMTTFHIDVFATSGTTLKIKLVDFGADGTFGGGDDTQHELTFNAASTPPLSTGAWVGLEIPLADFTALTSRAHVAQLIYSGDTPLLFVDNIYFHK